VPSLLSIASDTLAPEPLAGVRTRPWVNAQGAYKVWTFLAMWSFLSGCKAVQEAPQDIDAVLHDAWGLYVEGSDDDLAVVALGLATLDELDIEALSQNAMDGTQRRLTPEQLSVVQLFAPEDDDGTWSTPDPATARPLYLLNVFDCTRPRLERVLSALDQNAQYDAYDAYERAYTSSIEDFEAGASTITWEAEATASNLATGSYNELLLGGLRRVPMPELDGEHPLADVLTDPSFLLARTWIPFPADTERDGVSFEQDYQLELYLPWGDTKMLHLYGMWRELAISGIGDMEGDGLARITLNNLASWDDTTEQLCSELP
jgi:hypothetical protein